MNEHLLKTFFTMNLPADRYERGRQKLMADQPRYFARLQQLVQQGLALCLCRDPSEQQWITPAFWSVLTSGLLVADDLANPGVRHEVRFHQVNIFESADFTTYDWGCLYDERGWTVADFRPLAEMEDPELTRLWEQRSSPQLVLSADESPSETGAVLRMRYATVISEP